jgi:hypothetical protein
LDVPNNLFKLDIAQVSDVQSRTASVGGTFENPKNQIIDEIGFVFSTSVNPSTTDYQVLGNPNAQSVSVALTNLEPDTKYYVKMYAVVEGVTYYSSERSFTTSKPALTKFASNNCSNLSGVTSSFRASNGNTASWGIGSSGQNGSYWAAPDPNGSLTTCTGISYVQFNKTFNEDGIIRFWINTYNPGYSNYPPEIFVNGANLGSATEIGGNSSSFYWMQVESPVIPAGQNTIKIQFNAGSVYWDVGVDEIEFFEFN